MGCRCKLSGELFANVIFLPITDIHLFEELPPHFFRSTFWAPFISDQVKIGAKLAVAILDILLPVLSAGTPCLSGNCP